MKALTAFGVCLVLGLSACSSDKEPKHQEGSSKEVAKADTSSTKGLPFYMREPNYKKAAEINVQLGYGYLKQKDYSRAKSKFVHALKLQPKLGDAHAGLAKYYHLVGENALADEYYLSAIKYSKQKAESQDSYGVFLCDIGKVNEAKKNFLAAISDKSYSGSAASYKNLGDCMRANGQIAEADKYYQAALRHDPYQVDTVYELSQLNFNNKNYEASWGYFVRYKSMMDNNLGAQGLLLGAKLSTVLGDSDAAASFGLMLKSRFRDSFEYKQLLGLNKQSEVVSKG